MNNRLTFSELLDHHPGQTARELAGKALRQARELMGADAGALYLLRHEKGAQLLECAAAQPDTTPRGEAIPLGHPAIVTQVARTGETLKFNDAGMEATGVPFDPVIDTCHGVTAGALIAFALSNHAGEIVGVVTLANDADAGRRFADEHLGLLARFNHLVGAALERADILEQIGNIDTDKQERNERLRDQAEELARLDDDGDEAFRMAVSLLARAAEIYDEGSGNHVFRVNEYSHFLAGTLGREADYCRELRYSAQLHDVGKMGGAPAVLRKTGPLTVEERREMDNHTIYGQRILSRSPRLEMAADIALNRHEKWDGSGYPSGKRGDDIPLSARIVQMADIYDALRSERPYKPALDHARARDIILLGDERIDSAGHFDPTLIEAFADTHLKFDEIFQAFVDNSPGR
ncbi:MAG: HD domain-containing phosphohydrolase [Alphaproteobacteria bacterium]|jgi:HD-GYP domain-containing protein (c-di-GMP phosphodiesterase class II)|nr:HD domain-containing phosphohydrolase [Alphaproteobacteria bacterium]